MTKEQKKIKELTKQREETKSYGACWYSKYSDLDRKLEELHTNLYLASIWDTIENKEQ